MVRRVALDPIQAGVHGQDVFQGHGLFAGVVILEGAAGEEAEDRWIDAIDKALVEGNPHQRAGEALGAGKNFARLTSGAMGIGLAYNVAVANDQQAIQADGILLDRLDGLG